MKKLLILTLLVLGGIVSWFYVARAVNEKEEMAALKTAIQAGNALSVSNLITRRPQLLNADLGGHPGDKLQPLSLAAGLGHGHICRDLIGAGADINELDRHNQTPLHRTVTTHNTNIIHFLLQNGASTTLKDRWGRTPLDVAKEIKAPDPVTALLTGAISNSTNSLR